MRAIFACAGTGGHVNPAIAIANEIKKNEPDSDILFVGTNNGLENKLVEESGYKIKHIRTGKILRKITFKNVKALYNSYKGIKDAKRIIKEFKPDIIIGTGGYICVPVMLAAKKCKVKYVLHESNSFPGMAIKLLSKNANKVLIGFEDTKKRLKRKDNVIYTGTPTKFTKEGIDFLNIQKCKEEFDLQNIDKKIILVMCGSQGARKINDLVIDMVSTKLSEEIFVVIITGQNNYSLVLDRIKNIEKENNIKLSNYIKVEKFVFNMDKLYKAVDMCITRAGALTITELVTTTKPSIMIPLPYATENHQLYNAKVIEKVNGGRIIEEKDLTKDLLFDNIIYMLNAKNISNAKKGLTSIIKKDVEKKIYIILKDIVYQGGK
ncbi:MAG: undecaprenyldiphospho-muramoylpentapeptide beta-N-acetylglucosaminyltransferase [Clostridia bacterium]